ncbi:hypothetical protein F4820DRAFT_431129 [Hypoxylon rubiginosum]|uniref:Uncharacterized protein n=1 Tax=Hypoxylon rubiginosum TaxID=110542 RepID=A0ACB9YS22_9PEZI|nr:hypothetical protein F4820DRAFT_431129 [Hypoxylon rubiginosum]
MSHNILITGGSGYLGGTLLARIGAAGLPPYGKLYALVRTNEQAAAVKQYGAEPLAFNIQDEATVRDTVLKHGISVVFYLVDPFFSAAQVHFINALAEIKKTTGKDVHFLHTSGAKIFSSHAGAPTDKPLLDNDPHLYDIQKSQKAPIGFMQTPTETNNIVIKEAERHGVRSYIFVPCIVYGKGEGFGNPISIQTVAIIRAAKAMKRVYRVDSDQPTWPVCHIVDNTTLYIELLRKILSGGNPDYGKNGYYLASPGSVSWDDLYAAIATALARRNIIEDDSVVVANDENFDGMAKALKPPQQASPKEWVKMSIGGKCTFTAQHGYDLGWKPQYSPSHILEDADAEVELVLQNLKD